MIIFSALFTHKLVIKYNLLIASSSENDKSVIIPSFMYVKESCLHTHTHYDIQG